MVFCKITDLDIGQPKAPSWGLTDVDVGISTIFGEEKCHLRPLLIFPTEAIIPMIFSVFFSSVLVLRLLSVSLM